MGVCVTCHQSDMSLTMSFSIHNPYGKNLKMFVSTCHHNTDRQVQVHSNQPSKLPESQDNEKNTDSSKQTSNNKGV